MRNVTVVFPMAGQSQRFGNKFKPFLKIFDKTFIQLALEPFLKHKDKIEKFIFIVTEEHCVKFDVVNKFKEFLLPLDYTIEKIRTPSSVIDTIPVLFESRPVLENVVFCDCDHSLNVDAFFDEIDKNEYDCVIPGWEISANENENWSIAIVDHDNMVTCIKEKEYPKRPGKYFGVIGCYYFKKLAKPSANLMHFSEVIENMLDKQKVKLIPIKEAEFFGDPIRLENLYISNKACTIFCDLDGTIIKHENVPDYIRGIELLNGAKEKIEEWRNNYAFIILTTSRDEQFRSEMEYMLREAGIKYEYLVMGLPPGPRYLINDKKPYSSIEMAKSFEIPRNAGIKNINIGHSHAKLTEKDKLTVYKSIPSSSSEYELNKFKSQYESMLAIKNLPECQDLIPNIFGFAKNKYTMEYLEGYNSLHLFSSRDRVVILDKLFNEIEKIYKNQMPGPDDWLRNHVEQKICSKRPIIKKLGMDDKVIDSIKEILDKKYEYLSPKNLCFYYHGDLTYENILAENGNVKLIDFDNDNLPGCPELDLGKLMQSVLTQYEYWDIIDDKIIYADNAVNKLEFNYIVNFYSKCLNQNGEQIKTKAYFYCALHLFRMIPYQAKTSIRRANIALYLCNKYIRQLNDE